MEPRLKASGYPVGYIGTLLASSSVLGLMIPPSAIMILFAWVGRQSVLACFLAIIAPGILLTFFQSVVNIVYLRRNDSIIQEKPIPWRIMPKEIAKAGRIAIPAFFFPIIILGGVYAGIMTPTEAAAMGALYAIPLGFWIYRGLTPKSFSRALVTSAETTGTCMVMLTAIMMLSRIYITENVPAQLLELFLNVSENKYVLLAMINVVMIIIGMLMDDVSGVMLCSAILLPLILQMGVDPVHFSAITAVNLGLGCVTPPTAPCLFLAGRFSGARIDEMLKPTLIFIAFAWIPTLIITTYFPGFSLFIPNLLMK